MRSVGKIHCFTSTILLAFLVHIQAIPQSQNWPQTRAERTGYRETKEAGGRVPEELTALEERAYRDTTRLATLPDKTMEMLRQATALLRGLRDRM